jgi:hypothetical protein
VRFLHSSARPVTIGYPITSTVRTSLHTQASSSKYSQRLILNMASLKGPGAPKTYDGKLHLLTLNPAPTNKDRG